MILQVAIHLALTASLISFISSSSGWANNSITIAENGHPGATIVISAEQNTKVRIASEDLQTYIERISGAKLPIKTDAENCKGSLILVGKSRITGEMGVRIPGGLTNARREEGFTIISTGNRLVLAGNDEGPYHGTEYAVYEFLNRLGVRWFMPGEFGEFIPHKKIIEAPQINITEKPDFIMRNWWNVGAGANEEEYRWKIRNKMNPDLLFATPTDGSVRTVLSDSRTHPEHFAINADGSLNPSLPSLSHPEAIIVAADKIKQYFRAHPGANSFGFAPDDGMPRDYSPQALELNQGFIGPDGRHNVDSEASITEEWIQFASKVTSQVRKEFPDIYIATNGYANRSLPPQGIELDDHLIIMFAATWACPLHGYEDPGCPLRRRQALMLKRWCELCNNVWLYGFTYSWPGTNLTPIPRIRKLGQDFRLMKKWGVIGFLDESRPVWSENSILARYLTARLEWNTDADLEMLQRDFYSKWYGGAAAPMRSFYNALEEALDMAPVHGHVDRLLREAYSHRLLTTLSQCIEEADRLADSDRARTHVQADRLILQHIQAYVAMSDAEDRADYDAVIKEGKRILEVRRSLNAINPLFIVSEESSLPPVVGYWTISEKINYYQSIHDRTSGKRGDLVAILSKTAMCKTDPCDNGVLEKWYKPGLPGTGWRPITSIRPFYVQGHITERGCPFFGYIWYKFTERIESSAKGRTIKLLAPVVEGESWCWVNGKYAGHRPYREPHCRPNEMTFDVTEFIKPGETNDVSIRVFTGFSAVHVAGGVQSRVILYSPLENSN